MKIVSLQEVTKITSGFAFKSNYFGKDGNLPLVRIRDVKRGFSDTYYRGEYSPTYIVNDGDILIGMDGEFNAEKWQGGKALLNQRVCKIEADGNNLDQGYLYYFLPGELKKIEATTPSVTVKHLSVKRIKSIKIPLPPLPEQKRIAAILDKADAIRRKRQQAIKLADDFLRATFLDMFGDPVTNHKGWDVKPFGSVVDAIIGGWSAKGLDRPASKGEKGVLKISAVTSGHFTPSENKAVIDIDTRRMDCLVTPCEGDLLFSRANTRELVAATCLVERDEPNLFLPDKLWKIVPRRQDTCAEYLKYLLGHNGLRKNLTKQATGTSGSMLNISKEKLKSFSIPLPPIKEQQNFAKIFWKSNKLKNYLRLISGKNDRLFNSLAQRAFRGEL